MKKYNGNYRMQKMEDRSIPWRFRDDREGGDWMKGGAVEKFTFFEKE